MRLTIQPFRALSFLLPLSIGLTFPIQVMAGRSDAGAVSLGVIAVLIGVSLGQKRLTAPPRKTWAWGGLAGAFLGLMALNILISQASFEFETFSDLYSSAYLAIQAGLIFLYFSRIATEGEVDAFVMGMVVMGSISGAFFVYESINKLVLARTTDYTLWAHEYSVSQLGAVLSDLDINHFRLDVAYRSFGLLERHTTSALWMVLGFHAYAFRAPTLSRLRAAFAITLIALLVAQNFTGIVMFIVTSLLLYRNLLSAKSALVSMLLIVPGMVMFSWDKVSRLFHTAAVLMQSQIGTILNLKADLDPNSYSSLILFELTRYRDEIFQRPHQVLLGYGLGTNPFYGSSGDIGFIESVMRLGAPMWILVTLMVLAQVRLARLTERATPRFESAGRPERGIIASAAIMASIWWMDVHYSAWIYKSICPILFFGVALARRSALTAPSPATTPKTPEAAGTR